MSCIRTVRQSIREWNLIARNDRIIAAVSGGPDSVALLHILHEIAGELSLTLSAAFFDHGIRREAARERLLVEKHCCALTIPLLTGSGDVPAEAQKKKTGLEETARLLRYRFLEQAARRWRADKVALGHTRDDQVETILHHIVRGTGWRGATGMAPRRGMFIRPLLACGGAELKAYLRRRSLRYAVDRSNLDNSLLRNRIRNRLLPYLRKHFNPSIDETLIRMGENLAEGWEVLERSATRQIPPIRAGAVDIPLDRVEHLGDFEIYLFIDAILRERFGIVQDIGKSHFDAAKNLLRGGRSGTRVQFPHGIVCRREQHGIRITRREDDQTPPEEVVIPGCGTYLLPSWNRSVRIDPVADPAPAAVSDACGALVAGVSFPITVRARRAGDRVRPFGMRGRKKLSDLFIDKKIPLHRRRGIPVFEDAGGIFWVPGVAADERTRIDDDTDSALRITLIAEPRTGPPRLSKRRSTTESPED